jgi:hypothetical protein
MTRSLLDRFGHIHHHPDKDVVVTANQRCYRGPERDIQEMEKLDQLPVCGPRLRRPDIVGSGP